MVLISIFSLLRIYFRFVKLENNNDHMMIIMIMMMTKMIVMMTLVMMIMITAMTCKQEGKHGQN